MDGSHTDNISNDLVQSTPKTNLSQEAKRQGQNSPAATEECYVSMQTDYESAGGRPDFNKDDQSHSSSSSKFQKKGESKPKKAQEMKRISEKLEETEEKNAELYKKNTEAEKKIAELNNALDEANKKKTEAEKKIAELQRDFEDADTKKSEAEKKISQLETNPHYFTWVASVLVLVPLCIGLHLAFKGHKINHYELRLMLVGKTGAGKSTSGNTILGEEAFRVEASPASVTASCQKKNKVLDGRNITIIDTAGVMDTWLLSDQAAHSAHECISMASPDPHVFLLVIRLGRFTVEEMNAVKWIQENFGEEALKFTMVLFTGGDLLEGKPVEKFISNSYDLQNLVDTCEGRYHVFNNYEQSNRTQVKELFEKINAILNKNLGYFNTKKVYRKVQQQLAHEVKEEVHIREREVRQEEELKRKHMEEEMKVAERRKINEMALKLRDEQYENKNLKAELGHAYSAVIFFSLSSGILILVLIAVCVMK